MSLRKFIITDPSKIDYEGDRMRFTGFVNGTSMSLREIESFKGETPIPPKEETKLDPEEALHKPYLFIVAAVVLLVLFFVCVILYFVTLGKEDKDNFYYDEDEYEEENEHHQEGISYDEEGI